MGEDGRIILKCTSKNMSRGSSVSIVSHYGVDDRAIEVRSPAEAKDIFPLASVQTGSEASPASCPMGAGGPFPRCDADHSSSCNAEVMNE
jgi:hypothetical protein